MEKPQENKNYSEDVKRDIEHARQELSELRAEVRVDEFEELSNLHEWFQTNYGVEIEALNGKQRRLIVQDVEATPIGDNLRGQIYVLQKIKLCLQKLPPVFFKKYGFKKILLYGSVEAKFINGTNPMTLGFINPGENTLYASSLFDQFFHEYFHRLEELHGHLFASRDQSNQTEQITNQNWRNLEPGRTLLDEKPRIRDGYLKKGGERHLADEEQARYAEILFNIDDIDVYKDEYQPLMADPARRAKMEQIKQWLYEWSDGHLNERYWQNLESGLVDENYWAQREEK